MIDVRDTYFPLTSERSSSAVSRPTPSGDLSTSMRVFCMYISRAGTCISTNRILLYGEWFLREPVCLPVSDLWNVEAFRPLACQRTRTRMLLTSSPPHPPSHTPPLLCMYVCFTPFFFLPGTKCESPPQACFHQPHPGLPFQRDGLQGRGNRVPQHEQLPREDQRARRGAHQDHLTNLGSQTC